MRSSSGKNSQGFTVNRLPPVRTNSLCSHDWVRGSLPAYAAVLEISILGSVLLNEVAGPVLTKLALARAQETHLKPATGFEEVF